MCCIMNAHCMDHATQMNGINMYQGSGCHNETLKCSHLVVHLIEALAGKLKQRAQVLWRRRGDKDVRVAEGQCACYCQPECRRLHGEQACSISKIGLTEVCANIDSSWCWLSPTTR